MTQEEFNRRQEQAINYLDDAREKLRKAEQAVENANGFLDDVEQELDYLKDYEGDVKQPDHSVCISKHFKEVLISDSIQFILNNLLKLEENKNYDVYLTIRIED